MNRRGISGIGMTMHKFEDESSSKLTCIEDCPDEVQIKWIESMDLTTLRTITKVLLNTLRHLGDTLDITITQGVLKSNVDFTRQKDEGE